MTSPAVDALRAELEAAIVILEPQIRGLQDLANVSISSELHQIVDQEITDHVRRQGLCQDVLTSLANLDADGYPDMPKAELTPDQFSELEGEISDLETASKEFVPAPIASTLTVDLGSPAPKP